jgi:UDP-GlcNAc:undecaprenyl-phosphate GlcNAc-1-phosphate transferase
MPTLLLIFATALVFAFGGTPVARWVAVRAGIVARPGAHRVHAGTIPMLGGVAIYVAFLIALVLFADRFYVPQLISIVVGATWVSIVGVLDDRVGLNAWVKLVGQLLGAMILIATGVTVGMTSHPVVDAAITLFWVLGITNAMNLLDNMDGLSGGVAVVVSTFFLLTSALNGQYLVGSLSAGLLGASIGFLVYNFNPASIFMGDTGSLFLGFILAAVGIKLRFPAHPVVYTWFIPIILLGLPIFDTTLVVVSRLRRGLNPLTHPGTDHLSHRLVSMGYTRREAVLICYLVAGALGVLAMFCAEAGNIQNYVAAAVVLAAGVTALWKLEFARGS